MWAVFNPSLLVQSDFSSRFSGLVRFVAVANTFKYPFYALRFDRDYSAKLDGAESLMMEVSRAWRRLKLLLKCQREQLSNAVSRRR